MAPAVLRVDGGRHPWLAEFERSPKVAFGDLLAGYARVHPYERADAPDAARMLFGPLGADDPARQALGPAIMAWLEERRRKPLPAEPHRLQRRVREICEAFEIVSLLAVADAAVELRRRFVTLNEWVARLILSPARDARAEYWRMLALTQPLVAEASAIEPHGLAPFWLQVCSEAGGRLPERYLTIGLLGFRRLPGKALDGLETPWLAGLAQWALARNPSRDAFLAEWRPLKQLYPATPSQWRKRIRAVLQSDPFKKRDVEPPAWWGDDADFRSMEIGGEAAYTSPPKEERERLLQAIKQETPLPRLRPQIDQLASKHRRYAEGTGDSFFLVHTFTNVGMQLLRHGADARSERARLAQALAREVLQWEPRNRHAWSLWRDALVAEGALETAELVGWEFVRRVPDDPQPRDQLADLLAKQPGRRAEAEALFRETIRRFPEDAHTRTQLAELLIAEGRLSEAEDVVADTIAARAANAVTYAIQVRLLAHAGDLEGARRAIQAGLNVAPGDAVLRQFASLQDGRKPRLLGRTFEAGAQTVGSSVAAGMQDDPFTVAVLERGRARRLRFRLDSEDAQLRAAARAEVERWLQDDPTFAYAELLAVREGIETAGSITLPPLAVAFERALAAQDRARLEAIATRMPRLEALIMVARAVLGDAEAAREVEGWLRASPDKAEEPAVSALRSLMQPVLRVIEGGMSAVETIAANRVTVIQALHDANEVMLGDALLAA